MQASTKFDRCGRPILPKPAAVLDIPKVIPFQVTTSANAATSRITNTSAHPFHCMGLGITSIGGPSPSFRVKWPDGYYLSLGPLTVDPAAGTIGPVGNASSSLSFKPVIIPPGGRISVETSGTAGVLGLWFYGFLRAPADSSMVQASLAIETKTGKTSAVSCLIGYPAGDGCLIGYPVSAQGSAQSAAATLSPAQLQRIRYHCNGNIMAPEFRLGNQCHTLTPAGFEDEPFTFFSAPITVTPATTSTENIVIVPGPAGALVIVKRIRAANPSWVAVAAAPDGLPTLALRTPDGRSVTYADQIPLLPNSWMPLFTPLAVRSGARLVLDVGTLLATSANTVSITTAIEFEGVKRLKAGTDQ